MIVTVLFACIHVKALLHEHIGKLQPQVGTHAVYFMQWLHIFPSLLLSAISAYCVQGSSASTAGMWKWTLHDSATQVCKLKSAWSAWNCSNRSE